MSAQLFKVPPHRRLVCCRCHLCQQPFVHEQCFCRHRYISEDFDGQALHPVDILDISSGALLQQCIDTNLTTISPVNKPHPRRDIIITGSAR